MKNNKEKAAVLKELANMVKKYNLDIFYTNMDDGIHIEIEGEDVYSGLFSEESLIREADELLNRPSDDNSKMHRMPKTRRHE